MKAFVLALFMSLNSYLAFAVAGGSEISGQDYLSKRVVGVISPLGKCTGTPIRKNVILTAAHCFQEPGDVFVVFHTDLRGDWKRYAIKATQVITHPDFGKNYTTVSDLALVILSHDIPKNYTISRILNDSDRLSSDRVIRAGYGRTDMNVKDGGILRATEKSFRTEISITGSKMRIRQDDRATCPGDSGGPSFFEVDGELKIASVFSYIQGHETGPCLSEAVDTFLPPFLSWIQDQLAKIRI